MPEYTFVDAQFAFFFNGQLNLRSDELSVEINQGLGRIFNAPPLIFPLPDIAPGEIPFLQLKSTNDIYQCNVARTRADFFFRMKTDNNHEDFSIHKGSFAGSIDALFTLFSGKIGIKRLGYITKHFIAAPDPSNFIKSKFIFREIGSLDELTIRFNKKERKPLFEYNNIINLEPAVLKATNEQGVLIQRDINTLKEISYSINDEFFRVFKQEAESQFGAATITDIVA